MNGAFWLNKKGLFYLETQYVGFPQKPRPQVRQSRQPAVVQGGADLQIGLPMYPTVVNHV